MKPKVFVCKATELECDLANWLEKNQGVIITNMAQSQIANSLSNTVILTILYHG